MNWWRSFLKWFAIIFAVLAISSYIIVTFGPVMGLCFGLIFAACESGSAWYLFAAVWVLPALIAVVTSPFLIDYVNLRNERKARENDYLKKMQELSDRAESEK